MPRILLGFEQQDDVSVPSPAPLISSSLNPYPSSNSSHRPKNTPPAFSRISPTLVLTLVILALILFCLCALRLFVKYFIKSPAFSQIHQSSTDPDGSDSHGLQRQLQHLFKLHDSGLDQESIDALPVFCYKDIIADLKGPFDCAVCLCEFSDDDKLRLIPVCGHAFHLHCIDTWLLANSTCPLCRGTLFASTPSLEPSVPSYHNFQGEFVPTGVADKDDRMEDKTLASKRVFSVRLGRFRSLKCEETEGTSSSCSASSSNLDSRRCYSLGRFQYIVGERDLLVALSPGCGERRGGRFGGGGEMTEFNANSAIDKDEKRICGRSKGDSFSVSKIWLWPKKNRLNPSPSDTNVCHPAASSSFTNF